MLLQHKITVQTEEAVQFRPGSAGGAFDDRLYFGHLGVPTVGRVLLHAEQLPSTQTLLQSNSRLLTDGLVCVADVQRAGKGLRWPVESSILLHDAS